MCYNVSTNLSSDQKNCSGLVVVAKDTHLRKSNSHRGILCIGCEESGSVDKDSNNNNEQINW